MFLVGIATFIAGVVMLVGAKRVLHHSSRPPTPGTNLYDMVGKGVDEGGKRAPLSAGVYEEAGKEATQKDRLTKRYQELNLAKMERRPQLSLKIMYQFDLRS